MIIENQELATQERKKALLPLLTAFRGSCELLLQELVLLHPLLLKLEPSLAAHYGRTTEIMHVPKKSHSGACKSTSTNDETVQRRAEVVVALHQCLHITRDISAVVVTQTSISEAALHRLSRNAETCVAQFKKYSAPASSNVSPKSTTTLIPQLSSTEVAERAKVSRALDFAKGFGAFACAVIEVVDSFVLLGYSMTEEEAVIVVKQNCSSISSPESGLEKHLVDDIESTKNRLSFYALASPSPIESFTLSPKSKHEASKRKGTYEIAVPSTQESPGSGSKEFSLLESFNRLSLMSFQADDFSFDFKKDMQDITVEREKNDDTKSDVVEQKKTYMNQPKNRLTINTSSAKRPEHERKQQNDRGKSDIYGQKHKNAASNPYHNLPIWGKARFGHEFVSQSRMSILNLSETFSVPPCRLCSLGFSLIEKKYMCNACGCYVHKKCHREAVATYARILKAPYSYKDTKAWQFQICNPKK